MQGLRVTLSASPPRSQGLVATIQDAARASARAATASASAPAASSPALRLAMLSPVKEEPFDGGRSRGVKGRVVSPFLDRAPSSGRERGTRLRPAGCDSGGGDAAVPRNLIPALRFGPNTRPSSACRCRP